MRAADSVRQPRVAGAKREVVDAHSLVGTQYWRPAVATIAVAATVVAVLAAITYHRAGTTLDLRIYRALYRNIDVGAERVLMNFIRPVLSVGVLVAVAAAAAAQRRWRLVILAVVAPVIAIVVTEVVLKPLVARIIGTPVLFGRTAGTRVESFPSGHETGIASATIVALIAIKHFRFSTWPRIATTVLLVAWNGLAATALVRHFYHYPSDILGAVGVSAVAVLGTALALDQVAHRREHALKDPNDHDRTSR